MHNPQMILTPDGRLLFISTSKSPGWENRVNSAFSESNGPGLIALAAVDPGGLTPENIYWRDFAGQYLSTLCHLPHTAGVLKHAVPPEPEELNNLAMSAPPMMGGENLSPAVLNSLWHELDAWVYRKAMAYPRGPEAWLEKHASRWKQVGRVCFHLAENRLNNEFPFAFMATYAPRISGGGQVQYQPLGRALEEYAGKKNKPALVRLLTPVQRAAEKCDFVRELVASGDIFHPLAWSPAEAYQMLQNVPLLEESGLLVRMPDWWAHRPRARVGVTIGKTESRFGADAMLDFKVEAALGDDTLSKKELEKLLQGKDGLVRFKGKWIEVDREKLSEALEHFRKMEAVADGEGISFHEGMRLLAGAPANLAEHDNDQAVRQWTFVRAGDWLSSTLDRLRNPDHLDGGKVPATFKGRLRPYQKTGFDWLNLLTGLGLGACLADDMGLGKTIQVIAMLLALASKVKKGSPPCLLILPASLLANWKSEIRRFAPSLRVRYIHASEMDKRDMAAIGKKPGKSLKGTDAVLTTYGMVTRLSWLQDVHWNCIILDEAQAIKNPGTRQSRTVKKLQCTSRLALTGTPVENRLGDLWSLFDFLSPGLLGSAKRFATFAKSLEQRSRDRYKPLRELVAPYILRRLKTDRSIISDLPEKTEMKVWCNLTRVQARLYRQRVDALAHSLEVASGIERKGLVLSFLMGFKQICNHPSQFTGDGQWEHGHSGKFARLRAICEELASRQQKALIFTQFREITEPLAMFLSGIFGREGLVLHGGTTVKRRRQFVERFARNEGPPFFILSIKAGGTGLNLTQASHVIHFDRWWNPAVENQATDRAFRIGQKKNVIVHKFICRGTVEEKIDSMLEDKKAMTEGLLGAGAQALLTSMNNEDLIRTVSLDINRASL